MSHRKIEDLVNVETEHLLGAATGLPLVVLRAESDKVVVHGHVTPDQAREIAAHLMESAARAEYEADFYNEAKRHDIPDDVLAPFMHMIRAGEMRRHTEIS